VTATLAIIGWVPPIVGHPFMRNAFLAGTGIAAGCGAVGYFVVLRSQVFTGDALSHVAFTGALAALAAGVDLRFGLFGATIAVASADDPAVPRVKKFLEDSDAEKKARASSVIPQR